MLVFKAPSLLHSLKSVRLHYNKGAYGSAGNRRMGSNAGLSICVPTGLFHLPE